MNTVSRERSNTHAKGIFPKMIIYNNGIPPYNSTKENDTEQILT